MDYRLRLATLADEPVLHDLIARSIRDLGADDYTPAQIEAALLGAFGVDTALIRDQTYFVIESDAGEIVGCGGWSRRKTLFGSDTREIRDDSYLDPAVDAARVRAFFIDSRHARRGLGRMLLDRCEAEAARAGFTRFALMATLPGKRLYEVCGYVGDQTLEHPLPGGLSITFVPMTKQRSAT
ncbi:GNAT family N-acetyltransferase [Steroidobacter flavus]|uniref:GNAT family N-acetyltransferase n=1 Tax=Steroidobacter flavus TaxID=1842136 RepID=A0ABV8SNZ0_9GAMM